MLINIPDKICPHCGGTNWYVRHYIYKRGREVDYYVCKVKSYENCKRNRTTNPDKYKEISRRAGRSKIIRGVTKTEEYKKKFNVYQKKRVEELHPSYTGRLITKFISGISAKDVPQDILELHRKQLKLKRYVKENSNK